MNVHIRKTNPPPTQQEKPRAQAERLRSRQVAQPLSLVEVQASDSPPPQDRQRVASSEPLVVEAFCRGNKLSLQRAARRTEW